MTIKFFTGDDIALEYDIYKDRVVYPIDAASTMSGNLRDATSAVGPVVTIDDTHPDSDWANGKIIFPMTSAETAPLTPVGTQAGVHVEIQIIDPALGRQTVTFPALEIAVDTVP